MKIIEYCGSSDSIAVITAYGKSTVIMSMVSASLILKRAVSSGLCSLGKWKSLFPWEQFYPPLLLRCSRWWGRVLGCTLFQVWQRAGGNAKCTKEHDANFVAFSLQSITGAKDFFK